MNVGDNHSAFINCTRDMLLKDYITLLPSSHAVAEILESVPADDLVMSACQRLKEGGYMIALDDFAVDDPREPLTHIAESSRWMYRPLPRRNAPPWSNVTDRGAAACWPRR